MKDIVLNGKDPFEQITSSGGINESNDENKKLMVEAYKMITDDQKNYQDNDDNFNKKSVDGKMMMIDLNYQTLQLDKQRGGKRKRKTLKKAKKGKMIRKRKTIKRNKITKKRKLKNRRKTKKM